MYIKNPKIAPKLFELINKFIRVKGCKINMQKSILFLYAINKQSENKIKNTIPFTVASKRIKYLGISFTKKSNII